MRDLDALFEALGRSRFRSKFRLNAKDRAYLNDKGMTVVLEHAADLVEKRLALAEPKNDGKQTPWRGHPVFVAQHATATCCRGCLQKWHGIGKGAELTAEEKAHVVTVIGKWLEANQGERRQSQGDESLFIPPHPDPLPKGTPGGSG